MSGAEPATEPRTPGNKSAERALDVLAYLSRQPRPVTAASIALHCGLPRSSTYHLLNVMRRKGFLAYLPGERTWSLGQEALTIGDAGERRELLARLARPVLARLAAEVGEPAMLGVLTGTEVLCVATAAPKRSATQVLVDEGVALPAHLHAAGRSLLAHADPRQVKALYPPGRRLSSLTGRGELQPIELLRALRGDRDRSHSEESGLAFRETSSIAVPVFDRRGCTAAVAIMFRTRNRFGTYRDELVRPVRAAAAELSERLGAARIVAPA